VLPSLKRKERGLALLKDPADTRVLLCGAQVPFFSGGAERLISSLNESLRSSGYQVDVTLVPFKWYPNRNIFHHALAWRLLDLSEAHGVEIDILIATKFPSYLARHKNKVVWLVHQFRQVYDFYGTIYSGFDSASKEDNEIREMIMKMDRLALSEARALFAISRNVAERLERYSGLLAKPLYPPLLHPERYYSEGYEDFILSSSRLEEDKRIDLLIRSLPHTNRRIKAKIVGRGTKREKLEQLARELGVLNRVDFLGFVPEEELYRLYANAFAVYFCPLDEDYGYVTVEAFTSKKPVITGGDSGGILEFVEDGETGFVCRPQPKEIAKKIDLLFENKDLARRLGEAGYQRVRDISWEKTIKTLISAAS
jgi:glycosyltransferase involved in cell wall biosynthesis